VLVRSSPGSTFLRGTSVGTPLRRRFPADVSVQGA
jgi:hypothetical protein